MGLFERAISFQKPVTKHGGLLHKIQNILKHGITAEKFFKSPQINQAELDALLKRSHNKLQPARIPVSLEKKLPPSQIPLTWKEAGLDSPPTIIEPSIEDEELERAVKNIKIAEHGESQTIFSSIAGLKDGIEVPARLFSILHKNLYLTKAALLLYDPIRMLFAPWASVGFDKTTLHRLRIPLGYNKAFNRVANGDVLVLSEEQELAEFKQSFSSREFTALTQIIFTPIIFEEKLLAVILITELKDPHMKDISTLLKEISLRAAPIIFRAREEKLKSLKQASFENPEALEDKVQDLAQTCQKKGISLALIKLSLEKLSQAVIRGNAFLDPFRLKEDIAFIIQSLIMDIGNIYNLNKNHVLLLIHGMDETDPELLISHLGLSLKMFFRETVDEGSFNSNQEVRIFPENGEDVLELLSELT